jgi:hypothetical protein
MLIRSRLPKKGGYSIKYALTVAAKIQYLPQGAENVMGKICG